MNTEQAAAGLIDSIIARRARDTKIREALDEIES